jgi:hypothetical protein
MEICQASNSLSAKSKDTKLRLSLYSSLKKGPKFYSRSSEIACDALLARKPIKIGKATLDLVAVKQR